MWCYFFLLDKYGEAPRESLKQEATVSAGQETRCLCDSLSLLKSRLKAVCASDLLHKKVTWQRLSPPRKWAAQSTRQWTSELTRDQQRCMKTWGCTKHSRGPPTPPAGRRTTGWWSTQHWQSTSESTFIWDFNETDFAFATVGNVPVRVMLATQTGQSFHPAGRSQQKHTFVGNWNWKLDSFSELDPCNND